MDVNTLMKNRTFLSAFKFLDQNPLYRRNVFFKRIYFFPSQAKEFSSHVIKEASFMLSKNTIKNVQIRDIKAKRSLFAMWIRMIEDHKYRNSDGESCFWVEKSVMFLKKLHTFLSTQRVCSDAVHVGTCQYSSCEHSPDVIACANIEQCFTATNCLNALRNHTIPDTLLSERNWKKCQSTFAFNHYEKEGNDHFKMEKKDRNRGLIWKKAIENNGKEFFGEVFFKENQKRKERFKRENELTGSLNDDGSFELRSQHNQLEVAEEQFNDMQDQVQAYDIIDLSDEDIPNSNEYNVSEAELQMLADIQDLSREEAEEAESKIRYQSEAEFLALNPNQQKGFVKLSCLVNQAELVMEKIKNPDNIKSAQKEKLKKRVYFSKMNKKIISSIMDNEIFQSSAKKTLRVKKK